MIKGGAFLSIGQSLVINEDWYGLIVTKFTDKKLRIPVEISRRNQF